MIDYLECQGCGEGLLELDALTKQAVADDPYRHVLFCGPCRKDGLHIEAAYR